MSVTKGDTRPDAILDEDVIPLPPQLSDGLTFALAAAGEGPPLWGNRDGVAMASGEATAIVGPDSVGKTSLAHRFAFARIGVEPTLLGMNVAPADGKVLLVAADRPKQAARSLWRMVKELDKHQHAQLRDGLLVWKGPLPFDIVKTPRRLAEFAADFGASDLILDSLGFVATRLSDDETGSAIAQAFATASAAEVEVYWNGHPRKASGENKKPNKIEDVYGSRWITAATGSVLSLWGSPGDPVIEVRQLKTPAGDLGPFLVELDHELGRFSVVVGSDLLGHLRAAPRGLTAKEAGRFLDGGSDKAREAKARRQLDAYVGRGQASRQPGAPLRGSVKEPDRYFATPPEGLQEALG